MQEFIFYCAVGTCLLLIALTALFGGPRRRRRDLLLERIHALPSERFFALREELLQRTGKLQSVAPVESRQFGGLTYEELRRELRAEAFSVEAYLKHVVRDHSHELADLDDPFETVLADVLNENPFVAPLLLSRFDQVPAEKCHHQRCREIAVARYKRNHQIFGKIVTLRTYIADAKREGPSVQ